MLRTLSDVYSVSHAIQLSVAPVFLLTGIGAILSVMTNRLGRVIDRARLLEARFDAAPQEEHRNLIKNDLHTLAKRAKLIGWSINLCTTTAFLVCTVIALMFIGAFLGLDPSMPVALLFISAMLSMVSGLIMFLREIYIATANLRIGPGSQAPTTIRRS